MMNNSLVSIPAADLASAALLKIGRLQLLLPQNQLRAVEAAADVDTSQPEQNSVGWFMQGQQRWPVYCLSVDLALLAEIPPERRACVLLAGNEGYIGVLFDDVSVARQIPTKRFALPDAMALAGTPIQYLIALDGGIACASDARLLAARILWLATSGNG